MRNKGRIMDLTPPASNMVPLPNSDPISVNHGEHGDNTVFDDPERQRVTQEVFGQPNASTSRMFVTAPGQPLRTEANNPNSSNQSKRDQHEHQRNYKKGTGCLESFLEIEDDLWRQFHQMQTILLNCKEIEGVLQELSPNELDIELVRALRTLGNSLTGVRHILKGNILMMEEAKASPSPSSSVSSRSTSQSDEQRVLNSRAETPDTVEAEPDLLLDYMVPNEQMTGTFDVNDNTPAKNWDITLTGGEDPFIDAPREDTTIRLELNYQPQAAEIYMPASTTGIRSRRVILKNLPPDATLPQISRGIQHHGRLISIIMLNTGPIFGNDSKSVMLEFLHHHSAAQFTHAVSTSPLLYAAKNNDVYRSDAWLIPSASYDFSRNDTRFIEKRCTRVLLLKGFPKECIWYFMNAVGINNIADADYDENLEGFTVAFTTLFLANKVDWLVSSGKFYDFYIINPHDGKSRSFQDNWPRAGMSARLARQLETPITHRPKDDLEEYWNRSPYNDYIPPDLRKAPTCPTQLSEKARLALQYDIDESEVEDYLDDLEKHKDTEYRIVGSSITIKRRKWGWSLQDEDETKLLLENTLHEPDWAEHWDKHFEMCGEINRRKWENYGMVAKHRREKAAEQGLDMETVPECPKECEMGCRDIKAVPMAAVVKEFFDSPQGRSDYEWTEQGY